MPRLPYRLWLLIVFLIALAISAIGPDHPRDFVLEHTLTAALLAVLVLLDRRQPISNASATLLFLFMLLHVLGAHYTYSFVPYDAWSLKLFGVTITDTFSFRRNHYDRLVHFAFGLLLVYPMRELAQRCMREQPQISQMERIDRKQSQPIPSHLRHLRQGLLGALFPLAVSIAFLGLFSTAYELIEWVFAIVMDPEAAELYNGQQGDLWDAQKDMALALGGSLLSAGVILALEKQGRRSTR